MAYSRIYVDRDACIGAGTCVDCAPNVFALDDENIAVVLDLEGDSDEDILKAAQDCPQECVYLFDEDNNQVFP
jgi:ferredoxin